MSRKTSLALAGALALAGITAAQSYQYIEPTYEIPNPDSSYHVLCEQGGMQFELGGGLVYVDPDTGRIQMIDKELGNSLDASPAIDVPDRYGAARCSPDGNTWGNVVLDYYVPNYGASSGVDTGAESLVLNDDSGEDISDEDADDFATLVTQLEYALLHPSGPEGAADVPSLPPVPTPLYNIEVRYRGALGNYYTTSAAGVLGAASTVSVFNYYSGAPETLSVNISPSQTQGADGTTASSGYVLEVKRQALSPLANLCWPLEADVKVKVQVANPEDAGYPLSGSGVIELGYTTINPSGTGRVPQQFTAKYESSTAATGPTRNDFLVDVSPSMGCGNPGPMNVTGRFVDNGDPNTAADNTDLSLLIGMPTMTSWNLTRKTDKTNKLVVTSTSAKPIANLSVSGTNKGHTTTLALTNVPQSVRVCSHHGRQCNQPWRLDRASDISFLFMARDSAGAAAPMTATYVDRYAADYTDLALTLSDVAFDSHSGKIKWTDPAPFTSNGAYPMWFYFDTRNHVISGHYYHGAAGKSLKIDIPGHNTRSVGREYVVDKKWYGLRLTKWGYMFCSSGFSIQTDLLSGSVIGKILGASICDVFVP